MARSASGSGLSCRTAVYTPSFTVSPDLDLGAALGGGLGDGCQQPQVVQPVLEGRHRREVPDAGHLLEEGPRLEGEQVVLAVADTGEVHREAAGEVRVRRADRD